MTTRRDFVFFTGCALMGAATAHAQAPRRREVVVSGKRVKTIDVHAHVGFPEAMALMGLKFGPAQLTTTMQDRIRAMDEQGIDMEALTINAYWYGANRDVAEKLIDVQNNKLAEIVAKQRSEERRVGKECRSRWSP